MDLKLDLRSLPDITCLVIDDEKLARDLVLEYLKDFPQVKVLDQCSKGSEAVTKINTLRPDLIFLDIEMAGLNGFQVLDQLTFKPIIIFVTAYDSYAIKAFEVNASDYLLKPLQLERFKITLSRITKLLTEDAVINAPLNLYPDFLLVQKSGKLLKVKVDKIAVLKACKDYTIIFTEKEQYLSSLGIGKVIDKLNQDRFIRIHRSVIINSDFIKEVNKKIGAYSVILNTGNEFRVGRSYVNNIRNKLI